MKRLFTVTVKRPKWLVPTNTVPKGYDLAPGYEYFSGLLVLYPNSTVGLNVKAFSSRVYVVRVEGDSIAVNTCLVGDCIVDVDGDPITTVNDCSEKIIKALKEKKYVMLTIERAATPMTIRAVRCALFAEKTTPMDPRLATDTQKIGETEAGKIKSGKVPNAPKGILKSSGQGITGFSFYGTEKPHLAVRAESEEHTIGCEPYNPLFFHKVKQRGENGQQQQQQQPSGSTNVSSTGTNTATASLAKTQTAGGSGEKSSSIRKAQSRATNIPKEDESSSKKKKGTNEAIINDGTDMENSSKTTRKEDDSKRGVQLGSGKVLKSVMAPAPSTPASTPPNPQSAEEKKSEKSKKGIRGKTVAAFKSVTVRKGATGNNNNNSQRKN
uniref:PDZ domain-containing protein n=1 Tax=Panagrolaimus superbus TaxID=310955 RepID=A0A914YY46_9BILA